MKAAFFATADFALPSLTAVTRAGYDVVVAVTQPDRPRSRRGLKAEPGPVKEKALELGIPVLQPQAAAEAADEIASFGAQLAIVAAYGQILNAKLLSAFPKGCLNVHGSLLPAYRGAAPIERAVLNGEEESGVSIMLMDEGLDTGDVLLQKRLPIKENATAGAVRASLAALGAEALLKVLSGYDGYLAGRLPQDGTRASYAEKISKEERFVSFLEGLAPTHNRIRALDPAPGAYGIVGGRRIQLFSSEIYSRSGPQGQDGKIIGCEGDKLLVCAGGGVLSVGRVKPEGKKEMAGSAFYNGVSADKATFSVTPEGK